MHPMPLSEAEEVVKRNVCGECASPLTIAWGGSYGVTGYIVRCGRDITHEGFAPVLSLTQEYRRGASLPLPIENRLDKRFGGKRMDSVALTKLDPKEMEERVKTASAQFGFALDQYGNPRNLTQTDVVFLVEYCRSYGFDPILHEVCLFHGAPYPMIDGLRRKAQETGDYAGLHMVPVTDRDEKVACGYEAHDIVFRATVKRVVKGQIAEFQRYGAVTDAERKELSRQGNTPRHPVLAKKGPEMAQNRAERHAIRSAFHFEFPGVDMEPSIVVVGDPEGTEFGSDQGEADESGAVEADFRLVDPETGEILQPAAQPPESPPQAQEPPPQELATASAEASEEAGADTGDPFGGEIPSYGSNEIERRKAFIDAAKRWGWERGADDSRMQKWITAEFRDPETGKTKAWAALTAAEQNRAVHFMTLEGPNRHYEETK